MREAEDKVRAFYNVCPHRGNQIRNAGIGLASPRYQNRDEMTDALQGMLRGAGIDPETFEGTADDVRPAMQEAKWRNDEATGIDVSGLNDDQLTDDYHYYIFPNITLSTHATRVMFFRQRPHPTDPNKMYYDLQNYMRIPEGAEPPPRPPHTQHKHGEISLGLVLDQDSYNLPRVQKGMNSRAFKGLLINYRERRIRHMHKTLDDYIYGPDR